MSKFYEILQDSPVDKALKAGPRGAADWPQWKHVYRKLSGAADKMGATPGIRCSQEHVDVMADMASGHEERMKYRLMWCRTYGWIE